MKYLRKTEKIRISAGEQEYKANTYVMRCFTVTMIVYLVAFLLNQLDIFIIEKTLMWTAFVPSISIYIVAQFVSRRISFSNIKTKYFLLFCTVAVFTITGVFLTYHATLLLALPFLYASLYSSKPVMRYVFGLTVISSAIGVYGGYYFGLCDANMVLLTSKNIWNYVSEGEFLLTRVNTNPLVSLALFYVVPRCLICIAIMFVCNSIVEIVSASHKKTEQMFLQTVTALSEAVDAKDRYTSGHSKRVAEYSRKIAERMGKSKEEQDEIYRAGLLHDVGKIRIPEEIINKPGKLTEEEYNTIKVHPITGYNILRGISEDSSIAIAAKHHHERYDGKGYPNGLKGEEIPETARILGVADSYDAMASNRSYRNALPQDVVRSEIEKGKESQFDPVVADVMLQMIDEDKDYRMQETDSLHRSILTVDNEAFNNFEIARIMQDEPRYEIVFAGSLAEARARLSEKAYDLILLDAVLPGENVAKIVYQIRENYNTPIVLMIGDKNSDDFADFAALGCDDYMTKPVQPLLLKETIHNLTERTNL
ncbi:MAG: HD domain-containing protein [Lachnospiraceae bacterium]|nr:HD domain-containing protein [Lachnospiraceae bacterium]